MELRHLRYFVSVAEAASISRAAGRINVTPIVQDGKSLGWWAAVAWDPRRSRPSYSAGFIEGLAAYTRRSFPGKRFERLAPAVPRPPHPETAPAPRPR
jgi:hypothetical protein